MYGIVIVNQQIGHNQYKIDRFKTEFSKKDINLEVFVNDGTLSSIDNGVIKINLPKADFVLYMDKDIYLARMLEKAGYKLFNDADFMKLCDDKVLTYIRCANLGIKMIDTIPGPLVYTDKLKESNYDFLNSVVNKLGLPLIVKKVYGSLGEGVYLVKTFDELKELYSKIYRNPLLFQRYVETSFGRSIRALIIDKKVVGAFERFNHVDFRSNFGDTADGRNVSNNKEIYEFAQNIADLLNISYAGLDFLYDKNGLTLCEINSNAFFEEFEKITNINVAEIYRDMIIRKVYNEQK